VGSRARSRSVADEGEAATDPLAERRRDQPAGLAVPLGEAGVEQPGLEASGAEAADGAAPPALEQLGGCDALSRRGWGLGHGWRLRAGGA
jgi:hypothetical protein